VTDDKLISLTGVYALISMAGLTIHMSEKCILYSWPIQACSKPRLHCWLVTVCSYWRGCELCAAGLPICRRCLCSVTYSTHPTLCHQMSLYCSHHQHKSVHSALLATSL